MTTPNLKRPHRGDFQNDPEHYTEALEAYATQQDKLVAELEIMLADADRSSLESEALADKAVGLNNELRIQVAELNAVIEEGPSMALLTTVMNERDEARKALKGISHRAEVSGLDMEIVRLATEALTRNSEGAK